MPSSSTPPPPPPPQQSRGPQAEEANQTRNAPAVPNEVVASARAAAAAAAHDEGAEGAEGSIESHRNSGRAGGGGGSDAAEVAAEHSRQGGHLDAGGHSGSQNRIVDAGPAPEAWHDELPPPAYSEVYGQIASPNEDFGTRAAVTDDGRVDIRINQRAHSLTNLLRPSLTQIPKIEEAEVAAIPPPFIPPSLGGEPGQLPPPPLNVVIHVVGSRGDVQPFVALGKVLKDTYQHRVRLATHPVFQSFVEENGLEFFSIGGDPSELMAFMVKNPGLMPGFDTLRKGDIGKRRKGIEEMIKGCWRSCIEAGDGTGAGFGTSMVDNWVRRLGGGSTDAPTHDIPGAADERPFIADAIIANPPSFAHIHCAEKLGVPLHMMFTMPWSPTQQFPHPLANIQKTNADASVTNFMSYTMVDMLTWQGLGDVINRFRRETLALEPLSLMWAPGILARLRIPWTYCWSPALIPKPKDWGPHIAISGFYFLNLASNYQPDPELAAFLAAGPPPVYIGFGSIVVDDPNAMTKLIFDAVRKTGQRALVSKGWGGLGAEDLDKPDNVFMLGNCPHDWLFQHVSCVVHHGGAGTTAAGIACGRPTVIVPFFGDQPFWGAMVARAGAGPEPIPHKRLTADNLAEAIQEALKPSSLERAQELANKIAAEKGTDTGAATFHQMLKVDELRCAVVPSHAAVWRLKRTQVRLSAMAAAVLAHAGELDFGQLKLYRSREYDTDQGPADPITGGSSAIVGTVTTMLMGVADFPKETLKALRIHPDAAANRKAAAEGVRLTDSKTGTSSDSTQPKKCSPLLSPTSSGDQSPGSTSQDRAGPSTSRRDKWEQPLDPFTAAAALDTGKGVARIVGAGLRSPMEFTLGLSKGFHNTPKLYGEQVRQVDKVTDLKSGLKVAGKEFGYGLYDGITGLVMDPYRGAKKEGVEGFFKGMGKGLAGVYLKSSAGAFALPGYAFKGVYKELAKPFGENATNYIIAARTAQGYAQAQALSAEARAAIVYAWRAIKRDLKVKKHPGETQIEALQTLLDSHRAKMEERDRRRRKGKSPLPRPGRASSSASGGRIGQVLRGVMPSAPTGQATGTATGTTQRSGDDLGPGLSSDSTNASSVNSSSSAPLPPPRHPYSVARRPVPDRSGSTTATSVSSHPRSNSTAANERKSSFAHHNPTEEEDDPELAMALAQSLEDQRPGQQTGIIGGDGPAIAWPPLPGTISNEGEAAAPAAAPTPAETRPTAAEDDEDTLFERAIQASITELQRNPPGPGEEDEEAALQRAIDASKAEAHSSGASAEEQQALEEVLRRSLAEQKLRRRRRRRRKQKAPRIRSSDSEWDSSTADADDVVTSAAEEDEEGEPVFTAGDTDTDFSSDDDEELQAALEASRRAPAAPDPRQREAEEAEMLRRAMEESRREEEAARVREEEERRQMEFVRRQSLMDEEVRRAAREGRPPRPLEEMGEGSGSAEGEEDEMPPPYAEVGRERF